MNTNCRNTGRPCKKCKSSCKHRNMLERKQRQQERNQRLTQLYKGSIGKCDNCRGKSLCDIERAIL